MNAMASQPHTALWLAEHGPKHLEALFRAIVFHPSAPILIADDERHSQEASVGASKLLGVSRERIIGRSIDEFVTPEIQQVMSERWHAFLETGEQAGTLQLVGADGEPRVVEYTAKRNVLPVQHLVVLCDKTRNAGDPGGLAVMETTSCVEDYGLLLIGVDGSIAAWYGGAERLYGYQGEEAIGRMVAMLYPAEKQQTAKVRDELERAVGAGRHGAELWHRRKDGSKFWANEITMALRDESGSLQGFARVVRDFSDRRERDEQLRRNPGPGRVKAESGVAGVVSGEFDRVPEANDTFLEMVGYSRADLKAGRLVWPELTPAKYVMLDEYAHEEGLRFGASTPFEKELIRKDGTLIPVEVTTAVLSISPFRWITFVNDLRERDEQERIDGEAGKGAVHFEEIVGTSAAVKRLLGQVEVVAPTEATVLIMGETGTGKELIARAIHRLSARCNKVFVTLNCAAIPTGLLESELFGYERGAFTGALTQKIGRFELANGGTLFLDEVGDIPLELQPKLLRCLQEKAVERLGGTKTIPIDVRLVAATNRNLSQMMGDKLFRSDLYYRLRVFPITTPPLHEHPEDIPALARYFTKKYAAQMGRKIERIPAETMRALVSWPWPGNVRELENFIERSVILSRGPILKAPVEELRAPVEPVVLSTLDDVEREHILRVLHESGGVVSRAAARLGMPRTTLNAIMKKLGITRSG